MAAFYLDLTTTRTTRPDPDALTSAVRTATGDPTAVLAFDPNSVGWRGKKASAWTPAQIAAAQSALDTVAAFDPDVAAIDSKDLRALATALWEAIPNPLLTKAQVRDRAIAVRKSL
jgi:hypothetical protein